MYNIEEFKDRVEEISQEINESGLKDVNQDLFHTLSKAIRDLNLKIIAYQEHSDIVRTEELHDAKASIEALFEFYMIEEGAKKIANYQVTYIKERLDKIIAKLNSHNYETIEKEFNEALKLYNSILASASSSNIIKETITKFKYQVFKYKLQDKVIDDTLNINSIIGFIMADIDTILDDIEVSEAIKNELQKYAFNINLIKTNFKTIIILLNLGLNKKNATKEEIATELESAYYCESEIEPEYHEPSKEVMSTVYSTAITDLDKIYRCNPNEIKEGVPAVIIKELERVGSYKFEIKDVFNQLANIEYPYLKYLAESLICKKFISTFIEFYQLYRNAIISKSSSINYQNAFDCAIIAHKEEIPPSYMSQYVSLSGTEYLINYIIRTGNKDYFQDRALRGYAIRTDNTKILEYMFENDLLPVYEMSSLPTYLAIKFLEKRLSTKSEAEQQSFLFSIFARDNYEFDTYILNKLLKFKNVQLIIEALNLLINKTTPNISEFLKLLNDLEESPLKQEVMAHYYKCSSNESNVPEGNLICEDLRHHQEECILKDYSLKEIERMNIFEASFVSYSISKVNLLTFASKFYQAKLDWAHILAVAEELSKEDYNQIKFYCYLSDRQAYYNNCSTGIDFIKYMIAKLPESIIDFITRMSPKEIASLDDAILEIFATDYEQRLASEGKNINDKFEEISTTHNNFVINEFLAYIMHRGLLNLEILSAYKSRLFIQENEKSKISIWADIMKKAIINMKEKHQKAGLVLRALDNHPYQKLSEEDIKTAKHSSFCETDFDFNTIFLTEKDFSDIMNNETDSMERKQLKIRKYYGDLLRLIPLVPLNIQKRIIIQLAKSGIEEYIMYVKVNYPGYLELILENLTDISLYQKLIAFDGTYSIDDALRVSLIQEDKPQALV